MFSVARTEKNLLTSWWWTVDRVLLALILLLIAVGVALVMSASPPVAERIGVGSMHFVTRHIIILIPTLLILLGVSFLSEKQIWRLATIVFSLGLVAMITVLVTGTEIKGAQRWIHLPFFSLQPSELVKPAFAILAAWLIAQQKTQPKFPGLWIVTGLYGLVVLLLLLQPDLGMTVVVTAIFATQILLAGLPIRYLLGFIGLSGVGLMAAYFTFDHVQSRINRFLDPESGDNYQIDRSLEALQNGGFFGTGPGQGIIKNRIPDAHADFIFSVGAEELGFFFVIALLIVYGFMMWRVLQHLVNQENIFIILACGGLIMMFGLQTVVHIGSAMHILPAKGMTLPFISYGGSSMLSMAFAFGVILALTRRVTKPGISKMGLAAHNQGTSLWS
jgi:cell division protein FtsW